MSLAKITLIGQETRLKMENKSVFDLLTLPDGIDRNTCIDNIILECGEFETLYSDPFFMRAAIGTWSTKHYRTFEKWIKALNLEYNPLENYDRQEDWTDTGNKQNTLGFTDDTTTTTTGKTTTEGNSEQNGFTEDQVSAFDSNTYQESEKHVIDTDENHSDEVNSTNEMKNSSEQNTEGNEDTENVHTGRIHGNIGVTTSQQMLQSELDISRFNIIQEITNLFMVELCIMVYE